MPSPTIPVLGAATVNRKFIYEVDTANNPAAPNWTVIGGLMNSQFQPDAPNMVGDTDQAGQGFESSTKTGATWSGSITCVRKVASVSNPTAYDAAQEFLRLASIGQFGPANTVHVRVYEYDPNDPNGTATPRVEAYSGYASVSWQPQGGDMLAEDTVQISLTGQGALQHHHPPLPGDRGRPGDHLGVAPTPRSPATPRRWHPVPHHRPRVHRHGRHHRRQVRRHQRHQLDRGPTRDHRRRPGPLGRFGHRGRGRHQRHRRVDDRPDRHLRLTAQMPPHVSHHSGRVRRLSVVSDQKGRRQP
jgi:hypothetical protein